MAEFACRREGSCLETMRLSLGVLGHRLQQRLWAA
jgi:hypothetical protein